MEADTAVGFIVTAVEGLAAEHYRRVISEKTRDALARLSGEGRRFSGLAPYGFRFGPGRRLVPDRREQAALALIRVVSGPSPAPWLAGVSWRGTGGRSRREPWPGL